LSFPLQPSRRPGPTRLVTKKDAPTHSSPALDTPANLFQKKLDALITDGPNQVIELPQLPAFLQLMRDESHVPSCVHLLGILRNSGEDLLQSFVAEKGLELCRQWLAHQTNSLLLETMRFLLVLPVTMDALKENGKIGKDVKRLSSRAHDPPLASLAKRVVARWKSLIDSTEKKRPSTTNLEPPTKRQRLANSNAFKSARALTRESNVIVVKKKTPTSTPLDAPQSFFPATPKALDPNSREPPSHPQTVERGPSHANSPRSLVSCLADPKNRKPKRSITWSTTLQHVKYFRKDKESKVSEDYRRMVMGHSGSQSGGAPVKSPASPATSSHTPSIVPTVQWYIPYSIPATEFPNPLPQVDSIELVEQRNREKSQPRVFYPEKRHIPSSPSLSILGAPHPENRAIPSIPLQPLVEPEPEPEPVSAPTQTYEDSNYYDPFRHSQPSEPSAWSTSRYDTAPYSQPPVQTNPDTRHENQYSGYPSGAPNGHQYSRDDYLTLKILYQQGAVQEFVGNPTAHTKNKEQILQLIQNAGGNRHNVSQTNNSATGEYLHWQRR